MLLLYVESWSIFLKKPFIKLWHGVPGHFWRDYPTHVEQAQSG